MATDHIRYDLLAQNALRGVVRTVLADVAKKGLPGEHHFKITFNTTAPGVRLSDRMRAQYPEAMTIILQHQFWDMQVDETGFEVGLSFGGVPERLGVPFEAVTAFFDPAVQFGFQFETLDAAAAGAQSAPQAGPVVDKRALPAGTGKAELKQDTPPLTSAAKSDAKSDAKPADRSGDEPPPEGGGAEVVR
ncbi:MAG TPA: ClpXP protease specificity-enhancing factor SspB, partial [Xanthobacteraceae bacterium]|nr:ClpXP protease specificity-enhancing factor SspB [Xanthobacteraceae bacterium]